VRGLVEKSEFEQFKLLARQRLHGAVKPVGLLSALKLDIGGRHIVGNEGRVRRVECRPLLLAIGVGSQISGDGEDPARHAATGRVELMRLVPHGQHCFLHQFFRGLVVAGELGHIGAHTRPIMAEQCLESLYVLALPDSCQHLRKCLL